MKRSTYDRGACTGVVIFRVELYENGDPLVLISQQSTHRRVSPKLALLGALIEHAQALVGRSRKKRG